VLSEVGRGRHSPSMDRMAAAAEIAGGRHWNTERSLSMRRWEVRQGRCWRLGGLRFRCRQTTATQRPAEVLAQLKATADAQADRHRQLLAAVNGESAPPSQA
jgi:hypothetical protein